MYLQTAKITPKIEDSKVGRHLYTIGVGRGGPGGARPSNNFGGGGGQHTLWPPNNPPAFSFNFYVKQEKITNVPS